MSLTRRRSKQQSWSRPMIPPTPKASGEPPSCVCGHMSLAHDNYGHGACRACHEPTPCLRFILATASLPAAQGGDVLRCDAVWDHVSGQRRCALEKGHICTHEGDGYRWAGDLSAAATGLVRTPASAQDIAAELRGAALSASRYESTDHHHNRAVARLCEAAEQAAAALDARLSPPQAGETEPAWATDGNGDTACQHGTAIDVHCCNCHGGFLFDTASCVCTFDLQGPAGGARGEATARANVTPGTPQSTGTLGAPEASVEAQEPGGAPVAVWCPSCNAWVLSNSVDASGHHEVFDGDRRQMWTRCPLRTKPAPPAALQRARLPPIDVSALLGRFREGYGIRQLSDWCGHGQGAIEDVLREALRGQAWQSIETAPTDGTEIVALGRLKSDDRYQIPRACITRWSNGGPPVYAEGWSFVAPGICDLFVATHWQPLPAPPADRETGAP